MLSPVTVQNQNRRFSVMGIRKIINSLPLRRKIASQFSSSAYVQTSCCCCCWKNDIGGAACHFDRIYEYYVHTYT
jgi:hypothetical protein